MKETKKIRKRSLKEEWPECEQAGRSQGARYWSVVEPIQDCCGERWNIRRIYNIVGNNEEVAVKEAMRKFKRAEKADGNLEVCLPNSSGDFFEISIRRFELRTLRWSRDGHRRLGYKGGLPLSYDPEKWKENLEKWTKIGLRFK